LFIVQKFESSVLMFAKTILGLLIYANEQPSPAVVIGGHTAEYIAIDLFQVGEEVGYS
jgi:hypothetical protein